MDVFPIIINLALLLVSLLGTIVLFAKVKFDNNNYKLLFLLYIVYWISPMMIRQYSTKIHTELNLANLDPMCLPKLLWIPGLVYGSIGIIWKPIIDLLSFKYKSRKFIIYLCLVIQIAGTLPMIVIPCFITNVIQSLTSGIGAAGITVFSLMFNEQYAKKKVFVTVSLLSLPPMIAEFASATLISCVTSFVPNQGNLSDIDFAQKKISILKWIWIIALIVNIFACIISLFVKENKELVFADNKYKESISTKWEFSTIVILLIISMLAAFIKHSTSNGSILNEMKFIANYQGQGEIIDKFSAYMAALLYLGRTSANLLFGFFLIKKFKKTTLFSCACGLWLIFATLSGFCVNICAKFILIVINGFAFGAISNLISGILLKKYFAHTSKTTPFSLIGFVSAIATIFSSFVITFVKAPFFTNDTKNQKTWDDFIRLNWTILIVVIFLILLMYILFMWQNFITKKYQKNDDKFLNIAKQ